MRSKIIYLLRSGRNSASTYRLEVGALKDGFTMDKSRAPESARAQLIDLWVANS